jgi:hypothetical protein
MTTVMTTSRVVKILGLYTCFLRNKALLCIIILGTATYYSHRYCTAIFQFTLANEHSLPSNIAIIQLIYCTSPPLQLCTAIFYHWSQPILHSFSTPIRRATLLVLFPPYAGTATYTLLTITEHSTGGNLKIQSW